MFLLEKEQISPKREKRTNNSNNLSFHLEKEEQNKFKLNTRNNKSRNQCNTKTRTHIKSP